MGVDGYDYFICDCGEVVDKENFLNNGLMCGMCYDKLFEESVYNNIPLDYNILPLDDEEF